MNRIEISKSALRYNVGVLKSFLHPGVTLAPVVKANAYGHGLEQVVSIYDEMGMDWLCVFSIEDVRRIRTAGYCQRILVMGVHSPADIDEMSGLNCVCILDSVETIRACSDLKSKADMFLVIDTGMHRLGVRPEEIDDVIDEIERSARVNLLGAMTHFATSEELDDPYFDQQVEVFDAATEKLRNAGYENLIRCAANSGGVMHDPKGHFDMVRTGIATYGQDPGFDTWKMLLTRNTPLQQVMRYASKIVHIKDLQEGESVGYNKTWVAARNSKIAIFPAGYYDGIPRPLGNKGEVLIRGTRAPIVGTVTMNMTMIDVTDVEGVSLGDEAVIIGRQGDDEITAQEIGQHVGTINYEVVTRIPGHIPRRVVNQ